MSQTNLDNELLKLKEKLVSHSVIRDLTRLDASIGYSAHGMAFSYAGKTFVLKSIELDDSAMEVDKFLAKQNGVALEGKGHIYLVSDGKNTKIGATTYNPTKRLNELQVGNAKKLTLIGSYQVERRIATESMLHEIYQDKNIRGEWFSLSGNDIVDILNKRTQSSVNSQYQVLTTLQAGEIMAGLFSMSLEFKAYKNKLFTRMERRFGVPDRWNEYALHLGIGL